MEMWKGVFLLCFLFSTTYSFQCDPGYGGRRCGEIDRASKALTDVVKIADEAVADAYSFIGKSLIDLFPNLDNATVVVQGNMTTDEAIALVNKLLAMLKNFERLTGIKSSEIDQLNKKLTELIKNSMKPSPNAYLILDKLDLEELKNYIRNSLQGIGVITRTLIVKAIDLAHGHATTLADKIEPIVRAAGYGDQWDKIRAKLREIIEKAKERAAGSGYAIENKLSKAESEIDALLTGFDQDAPIVKRGIKDLWSKVESALDGLSDNVKQAAKDLIAKYKPKVIESLQRVKKFVIDKTKNLILELQGDIVKIVKEKSISKRGISDIWEKVKAAIENTADNVKETVKKVIEEHKPKVINALNNVKKVVIDGAKKIVVQLKNGVVEILTDDQTTDNQYSAYVIIDDSPSTPSAYGLSDVWNKIKEEVKKIGSKVKETTKALIEKYKPKIINTIGDIKEFVIDEGEKIIIQLKGDLVKVIINEVITSNEKSVEKRSIKDIWNKVKEAAKNFGQKVKDTVNKVLEEHKPKLIEALNNVKKVVIEGGKKIIVELSNGVVKILTEGQTATSDGAFYYSMDEEPQSVYVVIDNSVSGYGISDVWNKVKQAVSDLGDNIKDKTKALIEKYKPILIKSLNNVKQFIIEEGQKIIIQIKGDMVEIIESTSDKLAGKTVEKRAISDVWNKVKEAAKNLGQNIKDTVNKVIDEHKPKVIEALKNVHKVVIEGGKKIIIELSNGVVKILTEGQTATSDGAFYYSMDEEPQLAYVVIDNSVSGYGISDVWSKVKQAVSDLGDNIKDKTKALIEKYKPKIVNTLNNVKQFVIEEGQRIVVQIKGDIVEIIENASDKLGGKTVEKRGISDIWNKVKEAAKNFGQKVKDTVNKVLEEHKPKLIDALNNVKKVVIEGGKKIIIEMSNGVVKILTEGQTATSDGAFYYSMDEEPQSAYVVIDNSVSGYGISDVWSKVKQAVSDLGDNIKDKTKALIEKYKPKIVNTLNNVKQFVIEEGQRIVVQIKGDIVEIIENASDKLGGKTVEKRGISDIWNKVKEAAKNLGNDIKDTVTGVLEEYKPKVVDALSNVKKVVINGAKRVVVEINNGIVKILTDGQTATSDGQFYYAMVDDHHDIYVEIDDPSPALYGISDVWTKVKSAVTDLGDNIKDRVMQVIEEHKPKVIQALNELQRVIIDTGKKIILEVNGTIVKVIVDGLEGLSQ